MMSQELTRLPYNKIHKMLVDKEISTIELIKSYIEVAKNANVKYNAYREITEDYALNQAKESQARFDKGQALKIEAMPIGVKDNYCTKGVLTTACSKMLENFIPPYESTVTNKLFANGGIMIGKTNMDEFAMGSANTNSYFGDVINPYKASDSSENLVAGGSSGGVCSSSSSKYLFRSIR